jgi:hypothetical protein
MPSTPLAKVPPTVTPELATSRLGINPVKVVHETIDGEVIVIQLERGNYFSLSGSGERVWALLAAGHTSAEASALLSEHYGMPSDEVERLVNELVQQLVEEELIVPIEGEGTPAATSQNGAILGDESPGEFTPPKLEKYTDMQDHLLIDPIHDVSAAGWPSVDPAE